mgnify:FL=1|tara:strand:- start:16 stop:183 length:168 start_codon:yes stop_codon:yes gene_type:complete
MARLLNSSFADAPEPYDSVTWQRILRDIEMALTSKEMPEVIEGQDESRSVVWFME